MRAAAFWLALASGMRYRHAIRLDDKEFREQLVSDYVRSQTSSGSVPAKTSILILGNEKTGKSTLCQWLLARTDVCPIYSANGDHTTQHQKFTGHWFDTPELGELEVMDTKGFLQGVNGNGGADWTELVDLVKAEMPKIDVIVWTTPAHCATCAFNNEILDKVRRTFGTQLWENVIQVVRPGSEWSNTCPNNYDDCIIGGCCPNPTGFTEEQLNDAATYWINEFKTVEFTASADRQADWAQNPTAKAEMEATIGGIQFFAPYLKIDQYFPMVKANNPDWAAANAPFNADHMAGRTKIPTLATLRDWVLNKRVTSGEQWDITGATPRFGPSVVDQGQDFSCGFPNDCTLTVTGKYLSNADRLQVFPSTHTCGQAFEGWTVPSNLVPFAQTEARPVFKDESNGDAHLSRVYNLAATKHLDTMKATAFKVCYCEYGSCDVSTRFFQEVGTLTVQSIQCAVSCTDAASKYASVTPCGPDDDGNQVAVLAGETLTYNCLTGYGIFHNPDVKTFTRECETSGEFDERFASCSVVHCTANSGEGPGSVMQARRMTAHNGQTYSYLTPVKYECDEGYTVDGTAEAEGGAKLFDAVCGADGNFQFMDGQGPAGEDWSAFENNSTGGCRKWQLGAWSDCAGSCGISTQTRSATCMPPGRSCTSGQPATSKECRSITSCPTCGNTPDLTQLNAMWEHSDVAVDMPTEGDEVVYNCDYENHYTLSGEKWRPGVRTSFSAQCVVHPTEARAVIKYINTRTREDVTHLVEQSKICRRWETTDWGECSAQCGSGYRSRVVRCSTGDDQDCPAEDKPQGVDLKRSCYSAKQCGANERNPNESKAAGPALLVWVALATAFARIAS